jgi:hypothetical protein
VHQLVDKKKCSKQSDLFGKEKNLLHMAGFESGFIGLLFTQQPLQRMRYLLRNDGTPVRIVPFVAP